MSYSHRDDAPIEATSADEVYTVQSLGPGQGVDSNGATVPVVVVQAVNETGHTINLVLDAEDREMIDRCSGMEIGS